MATVIVAGGASGIGRASVRGFRARGDDVLLIDHRPEAQSATAEELPGRSVFLHRDLSDPSVPAESVALAVHTFGSLDTVLVSAALMQSAALAEWTPSMWDAAVALNLKMPFLLAQAAAPHLAKSTNASITFISSTGAVRGHAGMSAYQATKAALPGLCRSLTAELGPQGIRVNCILPGWIETPFNDPFGLIKQMRQRSARQSRPKYRCAVKESRETCPAWCYSWPRPDGRYITGSSIIIDGGYTAV